VKVVAFESRRTKNEPVSGARLITSIAIRNSALNRKIDTHRWFSVRHAVYGHGQTLLSLSQNRRFGLEERLNSEFSAALLGFNGEAVVYCKGISDSVAQEYAMEYARMLQNRAKGIEGQIPRIPAGLFEPNRNLIRSTLDRMWQKYFPR